jgi:hypothetical protein
MFMIACTKMVSLFELTNRSCSGMFMIACTSFKVLLAKQTDFVSVDRDGLLHRLGQLVPLVVLACSTSLKPRGWC